MKDEAKNFLTEHRTILFWIAIVIIADYWLLEGKLRNQLLEIFESVVAKVKTHLQG